MRLIQISDTHGMHHRLADLPAGDMLVHCGDFSHDGTEDEVLDFLNWFIDLPYSHKIFITGNHDLCLWDAENIEDLPDNVHFLQDSGITLDGISFFGIGYNHDVNMIPPKTDVLITHEPPLNILDRSGNTSWGNLEIRTKVREIAPKYHLFGHAHEAYGILKESGIVYSNAALTDNKGVLSYKPRIFEL